jgi:tetratricopeptide (TPR) repeat protein
MFDDSARRRILLAMLIESLCVVLAASVPLAQGGAKHKLADVKPKFEELAAKDDRSACLELWKENPELVLRTIDADLEGSLKVIESSKEPDMKKVAAMHARATWGAQIATEATGNPIVLDYAASFVGWNKEQQSLFRAGQAVYKRAMDAYQKGDFKTALEAGRETVDRASALGDWWGTAMGYEATGLALQSSGDFENALVAYGHARVLNHDLGLTSSEYSNLRAMIDMCYATERWTRGLQALNQALDMVRKTGNKEAETEFVERRAKFEAKGGVNGTPDVRKPGK